MVTFLASLLEGPAYSDHYALYIAKDSSSGAASIAGLSALSLASSGAITPYLLGAGALLWFYQGYRFFQEHHKARNQPERPRSFFRLGESISTLGVVILAAFVRVKLAQLASRQAISFKDMNLLCSRI